MNVHVVCVNSVNPFNKSSGTERKRMKVGSVVKRKRSQKIKTEEP